MPGAPTHKGIVQQARHCWAFSHAVRSGALRGRGARRGEALARSAWGFMQRHLHREQQPGTW